MTPQEILIIRNQMMKDIKNKQTQLVIMDSLNYQFDDYSFALETSITNGNLELVQHFLKLGARIKKMECLKDAIIKATCVDMFKTIQEYQDIKEETLKQTLFSRNLEFKKTKPKPIQFLIEHFLPQDHPETVLLINRNFHEVDNKNTQLFLPLLVQKISLEDLESCIDRANKNDHYDKEKLLIHYKFEYFIVAPKETSSRPKI